MNEEFKVKLTPKDNTSAYSQSLPAPINLKEDIPVELVIIHKHGIITTLPLSKYASPIFAPKNPNGKLRLLVDLRKINILISDDHINNNHPVSTLTDAAQQMAGISSFVNWTVRKHITAYRRPTNNQSKCWLSISPVAHLHTDIWHKALAGRCPHFLAS